MTEKQETHTNEERATPLKPDGIPTKKIRGKTFVTEIYFDKKSKDTFQDKLFKVVQAERKEQGKMPPLISTFSFFYIYSDERLRSE